MRLWDKLGLDMDRHRVIALVGGGGKTTTMYALAREAREAGKTVIVTTTTHILPHPGLFMTGESDPAVLEDLLNRHGILTVGRLDRKDKMTGGDVAACAAAADVVLAEADGARVRPLKVPPCSQSATVRISVAPQRANSQGPPRATAARAASLPAAASSTFTPRYLTPNRSPLYRLRAASSSAVSAGAPLTARRGGRFSAAWSRWSPSRGPTSPSGCP